MSESAAKRNIQKLQRAIVDGLEDVKAQDIRVFDTGTLSPLFERVIIASGTSNRQTKALSASVRDKVREAGFPKPRIEGEDNGEWIIVDCGAAVAHIMQPAIRSYYNLEEIWGGTPVRLKLGAAKPAKAARASTPSPTARASASAKTASAAPARKRAAAADAPVSKPRKAAAATKSQEKSLNPSAKRSGTASKKAVKTVVVGAARKPAAKAAPKTASPAPAGKRAASPARKRAGR